MPGRRFVFRGLLLGFGLLLLPLGPSPSDSGPAAVCAGGTATCVFEIGSTCKEEDGTEILDATKGE